MMVIIIKQNEKTKKIYIMSIYYHAFGIERINMVIYKAFLKL